MIWSKNLPTSYGDFLWISLLDCGCCVDSCGIAYVINPQNCSVNRLDKLYIYDEKLAISWEHQKPPFYNNKPCISYWAKCDLPGDINGQSKQPSNNEPSCIDAEAA